QGTPERPASDKENLQEALAEVEQFISEAKRPVILAGVQLARYNLGAQLVKFAERNRLPICTTLLSKSVVGESHPLYKGLYMGGCSHPEIKALVEGSDCLLMLGVLLTGST